VALQSAAQLRHSAANVFVVDLVAISMTRELGPLMAAIVVAGRSGSAVAAENSARGHHRRDHALKTMGLHPTRFLIVPIFGPSSITQPLVTGARERARASAAAFSCGHLPRTYRRTPFMGGSEEGRCSSRISSPAS